MRTWEKKQEGYLQYKSNVYRNGVHREKKNLQMQLKINVLSIAQIQVNGNSRQAISNNDSNTTG